MLMEALLPVTNSQPDHDDRVSAWNDLREFCDLLAGDPVLLPFRDGGPDWENTSRETLVKLSHWTDFTTADVPRLAILTDSFDRFIRKGADASVVTLWRGGTPSIRQIDGAPCQRAVDLVMDAICDDLPLEHLSNPPSVANDNTSGEAMDRLRRLQAEHGGEIRADFLQGAKVDGKVGRISIRQDGAAVLNSIQGTWTITETPQLRATPFSLTDPASLPLRDWLFGGHLVRRYATASVGPGGGGKTAHSISEALSMVPGPAAT